MRGLSRWAWPVGYVGTIFAANWAVHHYGPVPVGFGLMAPAGVFFAGLAFTLRDLTQDALGRRVVVVAILIGAACSFAISGSLAFASGVAFLVSEGLDFAIYTPLRDRGRWLLGIGLSNTVGLVVDSLLFLWLAFHSLEFFWGQVVGKLWVTAATLVILWPLRRRPAATRRRARAAA